MATTNQRRRNISAQQISMLADLAASGKPIMAKHLASDLWPSYAVTHTFRPRGSRWEWVCPRKDPKTAVKAAKRGLARLEAWGLVRTFRAPHEEAEMTRGDYMADAVALAKRRGGKGAMLSLDVIRIERQRSCNPVVPSGNREIPVAWAEITEAGRAYLEERQAK